ncbi:sensor histidine kinase [Halarcobacter anaerophilus]|uniref:histidine kinase n=1 Tax=Halarcobacter anaerophilus TaxID=877500 RepID=A0A4Q0XYZ9_9BACT|nr:HAMP domain-containing sensor histidine kinase [Halarcobacter anaerophilus]RXJ61994.1 hypothetical protein CRV06_11195 [Halarcobacter anaerophilus]
MNSKIWEEYLKNKYKNLEFDGIIIESSFASVIFENFSETLYSNIPKIYISNTYIKRKKNIIVYNGFDNDLAKKSIELAKKHNPKLKNIYLIKTQNMIALNIEKSLLKQLENSNLNTTILQDFTLNKLKQKISKLPKNSAVFYTVNLKDKTGKNFIPKDFLEDIAKDSPVPIYSFWSSYLGSGTIGGYMRDGSVIAQNSLQNLLFYIKNGYFKKIKPIYNPFIDYEMLKKYKIEENLNPEDTIYINRAVPIWESYPKESFFTVCLIILLLLLLLLFFILKIRNDKIKKMEETIFLQSRQSVMGEMISVIAHQWRQPLNSIAAMVQTVNIKYLNEKLNDGLMEKFKDDTMKQIRYMSHTIDDFRNFYNIKKEKIDFNIKDELEKTIELIEFSYIKKHIRIEKSNFQDFIIKGYPNELLQSFLILFQNSKDVLSEKKIDNAYIKITMKIDNNKCIIIFEDNGGGIQEDIIDKIFTPYFSTKDIKSGTGIGLFMAKTIIEKHLNGVIVPSNTKVGAKFEIRLFSDR